MTDPLPPPQQMIQMVTGYWITQIVRAAAHFPLADHLGRGSMSAGEIARAEGSIPESVRGFWHSCNERRSDFGNAAPNTLRKGPSSLRGFALSQAAPGHWLPWGRFLDAVKTGQRQTLATLGTEIFDYYQVEPAESSSFTEAMQE